MNSMIILRLISGALLIISNGFFVGIEFALTRLPQYSKEEIEDAGLGLAKKMTERLEIYLTSCQIGITASSIGLGVVAEPAVVKVMELFVQNFPVGSGYIVAGTVSFLLINILHIIYGEQIPTYLGIERTKMVARYGGPILYWFAKVVAPLIFLSDKLAKFTLQLFGIKMTRSWVEKEKNNIETPANLRAKMKEILTQAKISADRQQEVVAALEIDQIPIRDIMIKKEDIIFLSTDYSLAKNIEIIKQTPQHVRFPLIGSSFTEYYGTIYVPVILKFFEELKSGEKKLQELVNEPMEITAATPVSKAIDEFQDANEELALVIEANKVVGLVTSTDAWEVITGELKDPLDLQVS